MKLSQPQPSNNNESSCFMSFRKAQITIEDHVYTQSRITSREREVIIYLCNGLTCKEISAQLNLSNHTVVRHIKNIKAKMCARNSAHAVALYLASQVINNPYQKASCHEV